MQHMGLDGYTKSCASIVGAAKRIVLGIQRDFTPDELNVLGDPLVSVVAFTSASLQIYEVGDLMSKKGWHLNALQHPPALHIACTRLTAAEGVVESFLRDLRAAVDEVKLMDKPGGGSMVMLCECLVALAFAFCPADKTRQTVLDPAAPWDLVWSKRWLRDVSCFEGMHGTIKLIRSRLLTSHQIWTS